MKSKTLSINKNIVYENLMIFVFLIIAIVVVSFLSTVVNAMILSRILDSIVKSNYKYLISSLFIFIIITVINIFAKSVKQILEFSIGRKAVYKMEDECLEHYSKLQFWNINIDSSDVLSIIGKNAVGVSSELIMFWLNILDISFSVVAASIYVYSINYKVLLLSIVIIIIMILVSQIGISKLPQMVNKLMEDRNLLYSITWENIRNTEIISFLNIKKVLSGYLDTNEKYLDNWLKLKKIDNKVQLFSLFGGKFLIMITILLGVSLSKHVNINISEIFALVIIIPVISDSLFKIPSKIVEMKEIYSKVKVMDELFRIKTYEKDSNKIYILDEVESVKFNNLRFTYPNKEKEILKDISFEINNEFISIAGKSGCGKSTLLRICANLIPANKDMLCLNGIDIQKYDRDILWNVLGYINQKPLIMHKSLLFNITLGKKYDNHKERLNRAIEDSGLGDFVKKNGLDFIVNVLEVSNGELQKICFARLFYNSYQLLLLDEATAALDPAVENHIINALKRRVREDKIIVVSVAHRTAVLEKADKVIVFKDGRIEGVGNHTELLNTCEYYREVIQEGSSILDEK